MRGADIMGTRARLARVSARLAYLAFAAAIVLVPSAVRLVVARRPAPPQVDKRYADLAITWAEVAILVALAAWLVSLAARPRPVRPGARLVWAPVGFLITWMWVGVPFSVDPVVSAWAAAWWTVTVALGLYVVNEAGRVERLVVPWPPCSPCRPSSRSATA